MCTNHSGSSGHRFVLASYPGQQAVFDGSKPTAPYSYMVSVAGASNVRIKGLTFANLKNINAYGIYISGATCDSVNIDSCTFRNMLWNSDTAEAKFPIGSGIDIAPIFIDGSGGAPNNILIDGTLFATIACGADDSVVTRYGTPGTIRRREIQSRMFLHF